MGYLVLCAFDGSDAAPGFPPHEILRRARELQADHMVIGQQGKSAMKRWQLGSVAQRVVMHASVVVTVVP